MEIKKYVKNTLAILGGVAVMYGCSKPTQQERDYIDFRHDPGSGIVRVYGQDEDGIDSLIVTGTAKTEMADAQGAKNYVIPIYCAYGDEVYAVMKDKKGNVVQNSYHRYD